jgi:hypothetical protein
MAPRKSTSVKKTVKKSTSVKKPSSMVKVTPKQTMMKKHGKKLAALATLLAAAGVGAGAYRNKDMLKSILKKTSKGDVRDKYTNIGQSGETVPTDRSAFMKMFLPRRQD